MSRTNSNFMTDATHGPQASAQAPVSEPKPQQEVQKAGEEPAGQSRNSVVRAHLSKMQEASQKEHTEIEHSSLSSDKVRPREPSPKSHKV